MPIISALTLAFYGLLFGAIVAAGFGLGIQALSGGRWDFTSVSGVQAERYNILVDDEVAVEAARLLQGMRPGI